MYPHRPKRLARDRYVGEWKVAFTMSAWNRERIFTDPEVAEAHVQLLSRATHQHDCVVPIYCLMPDHAHILLLGASGHADLLAAVSKYRTLSGYWMHQRNLARWQPGYYDHVLRAGEDWRNQVWYIAQNPVRAGLVENWLEYQFTGSIGCDLLEIVAGYA